MKRYKLLVALMVLCVFALNGCKKFLDVVPDNVATIDNAFARRNEAEKYLFTCYSYMPKNGSVDDDPGMLAGDELWRFSNIKGFMEVARGLQNTVTPLGDRWAFYFQAIHDCNIFLDNVGRVPDLNQTEKRRWIAEAKVLKAYYNFYLMEMYGPIPLMKTNLPVDADENEISVSRAPADSCFNYIRVLLNEAEGDLPVTIDNPARELGRITQPIALSLKAKVLLYAASPLFNGNSDVATLKNHNGEMLFNPVYSKAKWDSAAVACKKAIDICHQVGMRLYEYNPDFEQFNLSDTIKTQLSIRNSVCERWNSEIIWANTQTNSTVLQKLVTPSLDPANLDITSIHGELSPPLKIAEMFYTENGVPINEDKNWDYNNRYTLQTAADKDKLYIRSGYVSAQLNFNREPRYYADMGFDGGVWYGQGIYDDKKPLDLFYIQAKFRQKNGFGKPGFGTITGYFLKKPIHYQNVIGKVGNDYSVTAYPFIIMRLSDLYLMYAEALNESEGPVPEVHQYINQVRKRAGLLPVKEAWDQFTDNTKYDNPDGMRTIIHQERLIEMAFEGQRFWDLRRWKEAADQLNKPVKGWDLTQEGSESYYRPSIIFNQTFGIKDYFWPISNNALSRNASLVQNIGW